MHLISPALRAQPTLSLIRRPASRALHFAAAGLLSHLPTLIFDDVPFFFINIVAAMEVGELTFEAYMSLIFTAFSIALKFRYMYQWCKSGKELKA